MSDDTIAALSTPLGRGGIAVIRISGIKTLNVLKKIIKPFPKNLITRKVYHSYIVNGNVKLDEIMFVFFKSPKTYTGEDLAEISIHSNPFLIQSVLDLIFKHNVRQAMEGEFTLRAFLNDKIDLIQAEAINDLINSNSKFHSHLEFENIEGKLSSFVKQLREDLITLGVNVETIIEFEEEQFMIPPELKKSLKDSLIKIGKILSNKRFNEVINNGLNVVIVGKVNVGKSSLFNRILMQERAIVSDIPGTTRDFLMEKLYIKGIAVNMTDVAGMNKKTEDRIEELGINRSIDMINSADLIIFMLDGERGIESSDRELYSLVKDKKNIIVINKTDISNKKLLKEIRDEFFDKEIIEISVKEDINIDLVVDFIENEIIDYENRIEYAVNQRQQSIFSKIDSVLKDILELIENRVSEIEIIGEKIRIALDLIGELTGEIKREDIINSIFSRFCIGK